MMTPGQINAFYALGNDCADMAYDTGSDEPPTTAWDLIDVDLARTVAEEAGFDKEAVDAIAPSDERAEFRGWRDHDRLVTMVRAIAQAGFDARWAAIMAGAK